jgi:DNA-binding LacI/PurR family transcriptional regulator
VKLIDVANHAGVAPSTVSYVLTGNRKISAETRTRVERSIRELGFRPNSAARSLRGKPTGVIGVAIPFRPEIHFPVMMQFVGSLVAAARTNDLDVLLLTSTDAPGEIDRIRGTGTIDGLLVMDIDMQDQRLPLLRTFDRPVVLMGVPEEREGLTCVDVDFVAAGAACIDHLADLGHRSIAILGEPPALYRRGAGFAQRFMSGATAEAERQGVALATRGCKPTPERVSAALAGLDADAPDLTAIVVHNELAVGPLLDALRATGRRAPRDVSIVAMCSDEDATRYTPRLTSVSTRSEEIGEKAIRLLVAKIADQDVPNLTLLEPTVVRRGSSGRAPTPS